MTWAREFAAFGIRVGAVAPGMIETPMTQGMNQKARDALVANIPVGRIGLPEDIWLAVKFVLECDYFNGRTIDVDGGLVDVMRRPRPPLRAVTGRAITRRGGPPRDRHALLTGS